MFSFTTSRFLFASTPRNFLWRFNNINLFAASGPLLAARTGKVVHWDDKKLFGFILDDETGDQLFCHKSDLVADGTSTILFLKPEERVSYELAENPKRGPGAKKCVNVTQADGTPFGKGSNAPVALNIRGATGIVCHMKIGSPYGFVSTDTDPDSKIFFHARDVKGGQPLYKGDKVLFDVVPDRWKEGKPRAISLQKIS
jgi:cold shock CspA family protein